LLKSFNIELALRITFAHGHDDADPAHALALLPAPCQRPRRRRTAAKQDEFAPSYA
jgi:hypothetical protein